jgi:hypothetical protein
LDVQEERYAKLRHIGSVDVVDLDACPVVIVLRRRKKRRRRGTMYESVN